MRVHLLQGALGVSGTGASTRGTVNIKSIMGTRDTMLYLLHPLNALFSQLQDFFIPYICTRTPLLYMYICTVKGHPLVSVLFSYLLYMRYARVH